MKKRLNGYDLVHIDKHTGEVIAETNGCTLVVDDQEDAPEVSMKVVDFCEDEDFVKLYTKLIKILVKELTHTEFIFLMELSDYVSYSDCVVRKTSHGNSKPMDMQDMADVLGYDYTNVRKIVSSLRKKGVMGKHETGSVGIDSASKKVYTVNPYIYHRGRDINKFVVDFYEGSGWPELLFKLNDR